VWTPGTGARINFPKKTETVQRRRSRDERRHAGGFQEERESRWVWAAMPSHRGPPGGSAGTTPRGRRGPPARPPAGSSRAPPSTPAARRDWVGWVPVEAPLESTPSIFPSFRSGVSYFTNRYSPKPILPSRALFPTRIARNRCGTRMPFMVRSMHHYAPGGSEQATGGRGRAGGSYGVLRILLISAEPTLDNSLNIPIFRLIGFNL